MKTIHKVIVIQSFKREFDIEAESFQQAESIVQSQNLKYEKSDEHALTILGISNSQETKQDLLTNLVSQRLKVASLEEPTRQELEKLWFLEDKLKNLIDG